MAEKSDRIVTVLGRTAAATARTLRKDARAVSAAAERALIIGSRITTG
jgi:hypothetical protein